MFIVTDDTRVSMPMRQYNVILGELERINKKNKELSTQIQVLEKKSKRKKP